MKKTNFNQKVWHLNEKAEKVETTLADYLNEYYSDECTSPTGVRPRLHVREEIDEETGDKIIEVCTWGVSGNHPHRLESFETTEEAENWILKDRYETYLNASDNNPPLFWNEAEIDEFIIELKN